MYQILQKADNTLNKSVIVESKDNEEFLRVSEKNRLDKRFSYHRPSYGDLSFDATFHDFAYDEHFNEYEGNEDDQILLDLKEIDNIENKNIPKKIPKIETDITLKDESEEKEDKSIHSDSREEKPKIPFKI